MSIGENIREHRAGKRISQEELAEKVSTNREYINRLENGKADEDPYLIYKIGEIFNCQGLKRYAIGLQVEPALQIKTA